MNTADKIKKIMAFTGLTQTELARRLGVSFPTLNSWVNGKSQPQEQSVRAIEDFLFETEGKKHITEEVITKKLAYIESLSAPIFNQINAASFILGRKDILDNWLVGQTYHSNSIEGSTLTERETSAIILENINVPDRTLIEQIEAKNHKAALLFMLEHVQKNNNIDERFVLRIHEILMNSILDNAGRYRNHGVRITGSTVVTANYLKVRDLMTDLLSKYWQSPDHIIKKASKFHADFEKIHPFSDGNGRVGRIVLNAMLLSEGIAPVIIDTNSKILYYTLLEKAQIEEIYENLTLFIADKIEKSIDKFL